MFFKNKKEKEVEDSQENFDIRQCKFVDEILYKIKPGHVCKYIGKKDDYFGFEQGKYYSIMSRGAGRITFIDPKKGMQVDFGLMDNGETFLKNWEVVHYVSVGMEYDWNKYDNQAHK